MSDTEISTTKFNYSKVKNLFAADLSDLCTAFNKYPHLSVLTRTIRDRGFVMVSAVTGRAVDFRFVEERRDGTVDNELIGWFFAPTDNYLFGKGVRAMVYND